MAKKMLKGRVADCEKSLYTGIRDSVYYLIFVIEWYSKGLSNVRVIPYKDVADLMAKGTTYVKGLTSSQVQGILDSFDSLGRIPINGNASGHKVSNWANWFANPNTQATQVDGGWQLTLEYTVPATGWIITLTSKVCDNQNDCFDDILVQVRRHYGGVHLDWFEVEETPPAEETPPTPASITVREIPSSTPAAEEPSDDMKALEESLFGPTPTEEDEESFELPF